MALENNPHLDEIIPYPDAWVQSKQPLGFMRLIHRLRSKHFDRTYIFHSHTMIHLMTVLAGIPQRYGFYDRDLKKGGRFLSAKTEWQPNTDRYVADNYLDIPRLAGWQGNDLELDFFLSETEQQAVDDYLKQHSISAGEFFVVAPGGGVNPRQNVFEKRWDGDRYADFCTKLYKTFGLPIIITGSRHETPIAEEITSKSTAQFIDAVGKLSFRITAGLVQRAKMLICNDSAIVHIAVALGVPSLAIFGPSNPRSLLPVSQVNQWISSGLDCSPCYCNSIFAGCDHLRCMKELLPTQVMQRVIEMQELVTQRLESSAREKIAED
ncbi:MAG: glycosyltransferase family 9 protein [bacterium]